MVVRPRLSGVDKKTAPVGRALPPRRFGDYWFLSLSLRDVESTLTTVPVITTNSVSLGDAHHSAGNYDQQCIAWRRSPPQCRRDVEELQNPSTSRLEAQRASQLPNKKKKKKKVRVGARRAAKCQGPGNVARDPPEARHLARERERERELVIAATRPLHRGVAGGGVGGGVSAGARCSHHIQMPPPRSRRPNTRREGGDGATHNSELLVRSHCATAATDRKAVLPLFKRFSLPLIVSFTHAPSPIVRPTSRTLHSSDTRSRRLSSRWSLLPPLVSLVCRLSPKLQPLINSRPRASLHYSFSAGLDLENVLKAVHDKVNTFEINLRKKSLPMPAYASKGALSDMRPPLDMCCHLNIKKKSINYKIPGRDTPGFLHVGVVPDDAVGRRVFSGISRLSPPLHSAAAKYSPHFLTLIGSQDFDVKSYPNISSSLQLSREVCLVLYGLKSR
ncbi:hypothetical protein PR048_009810 [Dryococelus australis]|uniref:Uncharacterized protein n=1 Tax=Dryococelus australis TaxID=614101 RepID=A0ABQ9I1D3_9NEOP|nr:hypothetical protein PR048_009810 [Dryococelus australis]